MKRRRSRIAVKIEETDQPNEIEVATSVLAARKAQPVTSAHEISAPSPCVVCGGACEPASIHWGPWRLHTGCQRLLGDPVARLVAAGRVLGVDLSREDAMLLPFRVHRYADTHPEPTWSDTDPMRSRMRWRHVDGDQLKAAVLDLPQRRADAGLDPTTCSTGACAWCGVVESRGHWADRGHHWPDGSPAPLCGSCAEVFDHNGLTETSWWSDQRAGIAEAVSGVPTPLGHTPPEGLRGYAEAEPASSGRSDGTPWSHLPAEAVETFRWVAWGLYGGRYAPPEHRSEALRRAEAVRDAKAAHKAAREAEEAQRADVFGFAGPR